MPADFPALVELARYVPHAGDQVAVHLDSGETETVEVLRSEGSHIVVKTGFTLTVGNSVGLVWLMSVGHAWCTSKVVSIVDGEVELALGTVTVREARRARRTPPKRPVATSVRLGDGTDVTGQLLDVSDGGAAVLVPEGSIRPGLVVHVTFTSEGETPVEADCVVMHATARGAETLVGLAVETGTSGLLRLAGVSA